MREPSFEIPSALIGPAPTRVREPGLDVDLRVWQGTTSRPFASDGPDCSNEAMPQHHARVAILMHRWVGYLHGIQLGIAAFVAQRPDWLCIHLAPDSHQFPAVPDMPLDGIIAYVETDHVAMLKRCNVPVVDVSNWRHASHFPRVLPDDRAIGRAAATHLIDLGLRHYAYRGYPDTAFSDLRREGFTTALGEWNFEPHIWSPQIQPPKDLEVVPGLNPSILAWLLELPKPVGIFCCNDVAACEILDHCRYAHLRVPEEVGILGVDNDELLTQISHPPISSIGLQTEKIGFEAAHLLDDLMSGGQPPARPLVFPPVGVVQRQSTNLLAIDDESVLLALKCIRERVHHRLRVEDLLEVVPVNRRYLERRFKEYLGRTPLQEIRRVRIETAKRLLSDTDLSMPAVAKRSGFPNPERLANVFHTMVGITPTQYRRNFRLHDF